MSKGKLLVSFVFILGLAALVKGFLRDLERNKPTPVQYIIYFDARVNDSRTGMRVSNQNDFSWPDPTFFINRSYRLDYQGTVRGGETLDLSFQDFRNDAGEPFPGVSQFHDFDIRTATMAHARRR